MYFTKGIEAVATITELRSKTSELVEHAKGIDRGILIQKNNEPYAVLISYDVYEKLLKGAGSGGNKSKWVTARWTCCQMAAVPTGSIDYRASAEYVFDARFLFDVLFEFVDASNDGLAVHVSEMDR